MDSKEEFEIVHGGARGVDFLGDKYAKKELRFKLGNGIRKFPAQWSVYGKGAGMVRNKEMAEYATHLIAFWDGKSRGTKLMIDLAEEFELRVKVQNFTNNANENGQTLNLDN